MQTNEIREKLKDKNFEEKALNYICNFIEEFDSIFGKYLSKEEVVNRIVNNLDNFILSYDFKESKSTALGTYCLNSIMISKYLDNKEELIKSVIFHEMIHCITTEPESFKTGFTQKYFSEEDFGTIDIPRKGFTEGFTQYATKIRDSKYSLTNAKIDAYPILAEQVQNIVSLIGEDKFFDIAFNNQKNFIEEIRWQYGDVVELEELDFLFDAFDTIWEKEKDICKQENRLLNRLFGEMGSEELKFAKKTIINTLGKLTMAKPITTINEINEIYDKMETYAWQLNSKVDVKTYELLYDKIKGIQKNNNLEINEVIERIDSEYLRMFVKQEDYINSIKELTNKEKLEKISQPDTEKEMDENGFYDGLSYSSEQLAKLANTIIKTDSEDIGNDLVLILQCGLAETILKNDWNVDRIGFEYIFFECDRIIFNLYETNISEKKYLGTYGLLDYSKFEEYTHNISNERREEISQKYSEIANMLLLESQSGNILAYKGDNQYVNEDGEIGKLEYCKSKEERIVKNLNNRLGRYERLRELEAPEIIIDSEFKIIQDVINELKEIGGKESKILEKLKQLSQEELKENLSEIKNEITTSKLGLEILEIEKDFSRLDKVESEMKGHLSEHEKTSGKLEQLLEEKVNEMFGED